ncbi:MAG: saccharopine dehydrogenase [Cytophagaceae bacterium]|jgi:saccharopine dehydrogenase (NAD+, L-lysine-forming)/saccharopine dehydrogenase (NADP+, L-glutamate forming)|nr:saccharopine dehydrogenase [Cytophagaceae bacterium]
MKLLVLGIGRSATTLLKYIHEVLLPQGVACIAVDQSESLVQQRKALFPSIQFSTQPYETFLTQSDIVISLLPPTHHINVIQQCLHYQKHFFSASYATPEIKAQHLPALQQNILIAMEAGLDPGIDHMSCLALIDSIRQQGGLLHAIHSYTGGLLHPTAFDSPWKYKVSWNPQNIVLAGQGPPATYLENGSIHRLSYTQLFKQTTTWNINNDSYEGYYNRDSLSYIPLYDIEGIQTFVRGTLRYPGFCSAWAELIDSGATDAMTSLPAHIQTEKAFWAYYRSTSSDTYHPYRVALGAEASDLLPDHCITPALVLQHLVVKYWKLLPADQDRVVMLHQIEYTLDHQTYKKTSHLVVDGTDASYTAMAATVGLPLIFWVELFLQQKYRERGVQLPLQPKVYQPILSKLEAKGIAFQEYTQRLT